ncbi:MAG: histidine phosphatase family protein [Clostridiales bacterium]|nr:histidine phosphatase family protein [Clostridiales bacterium]
MLSIVLLRHGKTEGNLSGRYNGRTDDPLCEEGVREAQAAPHYPHVSLVYASPLKRTQQTARICFPNAEIVTIDDLREMDFGDFEGRTAAEMENDADYRAWVAGGCVDLCPGGESIPLFARRAAAAFAGAVADAMARGEHEVGFAVHGGVIMAVMSAFSGSGEPYHAWYVLNCGGYEITIDETAWAEKKEFASFRLFGKKGDRRDMIGSQAEA